MAHYPSYGTDPSSIRLEGLFSSLAEITSPFSAASLAKRNFPCQLEMNIPAVVLVFSDTVVVNTVSISSKITNMAKPRDALLLRLTLNCRCTLERCFTAQG